MELKEIERLNLEVGKTSVDEGLEVFCRVAGGGVGIEPAARLGRHIKGSRGSTCR